MRSIDLQHLTLETLTMAIINGTAGNDVLNGVVDLPIIDLPLVPIDPLPPLPIPNPIPPVTLVPLPLPQPSPQPSPQALLIPPIPPLILDRNDIINGFEGNDIIHALNTNDTIDGGSGDDSIYAGGGSDNIFGDSGNDFICGESGNDVIDAGTGNDYVNGGLGADVMDGGDGNDLYFVDNVGDVVKEKWADFTGGDADLVNSSVSYSLAPGTAGQKGYGIENLTLTGVGSISATGNSLNNTLTGNSAANSLNGGNGNDILIGGRGRDVLTGGLGNDSFLFGEAGVVNSDRITDFNTVDDTIVLRNSLDSGLAGSINPGIKGLLFAGGDVAGNVLSNGWFFKAPSTTTINNLSGIHLQTDTGNIFYDPTSNSVGNDRLLLGTVSLAAAASMTHLDFVYGA